MIGQPHLLVDKSANHNNLIKNENKFVYNSLKIVYGDNFKLNIEFIMNSFRDERFYNWSSLYGREKTGGMRYSEMEEGREGLMFGLVQRRINRNKPYIDEYIRLIDYYSADNEFKLVTGYMQKSISTFTNPYVISKLEHRLDIVDWEVFSKNKCAIHILEKNLDKVDWDNLSLNENAIHLLIKLDTKKMKQNMKPFAEELVAYVFHPVRLNRIATRLGIDLDDLLDTF